MSMRVAFLLWKSHFCGISRVFCSQTKQNTALISLGVSRHFNNCVIFFDILTMHLPYSFEIISGIAYNNNIIKGGLFNNTIVSRKYDPVTSAGQMSTSDTWTIYSPLFSSWHHSRVAVYEGTKEEETHYSIHFHWVVRSCRCEFLPRLVDVTSSCSIASNWLVIIYSCDLCSSKYSFRFILKWAYMFVCFFVGFYLFSIFASSSINKKGVLIIDVWMLFVLYIAIEYNTRVLCYCCHFSYYTHNPLGYIIHNTSKLIMILALDPSSIELLLLQYPP